jgi:hypothetical protein
MCRKKIKKEEVRDRKKVGRGEESREIKSKRTAERDRGKGGKDQLKNDARGAKLLDIWIAR